MKIQSLALAAALLGSLSVPLAAQAQYLPNFTASETNYQTYTNSLDKEISRPQSRYSPQAHMLKAEQYIREGNGAEALREANFALQQDRSNRRANFDQGLAYYLLKEYDKAINAYSRTVGSQNYFAPAFSNRGELYGLKGDFRNALEDFRIALNMEKGDQAYIRADLQKTYQRFRDSKKKDDQKLKAGFETLLAK